MKAFKTLFILFSMLMIGLPSCKKVKTPEAELERKKWIAGFTDSIDFYKERSLAIENSLQSLQQSMAAEMESFDYVKKPREVSGYYLLNGWSSKLPFTSTAIYARINENEKLELIATLGGKTFNRIKVGNFYSEMVPHDQAFNYRHERFNTVYFSGGKADTIAEYIALHNDQKINMQFIENNKVSDYIIPENQKNMIAKTWQLYNSQLKVKKLEKELWLCSRKIDTFRRMMEREETQQE